MEKYEKEVARAQLNNEKDVLEKLKELYQKALDDINEKIASLLTREDSDMQYVIYQVQYQHALKKQIQSILIQLQNEEFDSISEYLTKCYEDGYEGALYALQKQGIPLAIPIDQDLVVEAVQHETKLSEDLYTSLGKNIEDMQKKIQSEISRGIATGKMYQDIAADLSRSAGVSYNNAMRIARTEGHRIQCKATMDACYKAQDRGAEIVKQWNAALDARTRDSHLKIDGEIKNLDEKFSNGLLYPGDPAGKASEVINCRCTLSQRARWALEWSNQTKYLGDTDAMSDKQLQVIADKLHISVSELKEYSKQIIPIKAKDYSDFKVQYSNIWNYHGSKAEKEAKERIEKRRTEQREKKKEERKKQSLDKNAKSSKIKNVELPSEVSSIRGMAADTEKAISDAFDKIKEEYNVKIENFVIKSLGPDNDKVPFQYIPENVGGYLRSSIAINKDYYFNDSLDAYNKRIMRNYNSGVLASQSIEDLIAHEMAHVMTFQDCDTYGMFERVEEEVRYSFISGMSGYADSTYDGAETIAEAFVRYRRGENMPDNVMKLLEKYIVGRKK